MKAILLAAGLGTRLEPLTQNIPKSMINILGKPILEYIILELSKYGVDDFLIITGHLGQQIQDYFGNGKKFHVKISYIEQLELKGTGHATKLAKDFVENENFIVYLADTLIPDYLGSFFASLKNKEFEIDLISSYIKPEQSSASGIIEVKNDLVIALNEKPTEIKSPLSWAGVAVFKSKKIFEILDQTAISSRGELELTDAMDLMIKDGYLIKNHICPRYFDIGTPKGLLDLMKYLLSNNRAHHKSENSFTTPVFYSPSTRIGKNSKIGPFVSIGKNVCINDNVEIKESIILDNSTVESGSNISNSIVFGNSHVIKCI